MWKYVLSYTRLIIFISLLGTSCIYNDTMFSGITTAKSAWFFLITGATLLFLATLFLTSKINIKLNRLDIAIGLFFAFIIINNSFHDLQFFSIKNIENIALFIVYLFVKGIFTGRKPLYQPITIFLLAFTLAQTAAAVLQWFEYLPSYNSNFKFTGFFFNPSPFVIFLAALMVYCLAAWLYHSNRFIKIAALIVFILGLPVVAITLSRAAWLGLLAGVLLLLILRFKAFSRISSYFKNVGARVATLAVVLFLTLFTAYYLYKLKPDSADGRVLVWKLGLNMVRDHPVTGTGQDGFHGSVLKYQSLYFQTHPERMPTEGRLADQVAYAFNDLLQLTAEQGIIGLVLFVTIIGIALKWGLSLFRSARDKSFIAGPLAAIIVLLVSGLFSYPLVMLPIQILFYSSLAILSAGYTNKAAGNNQNIKMPYRLSIAMACLISGTFYISYAINTYKAYTQAYNVKENGYRDHPLNKLGRYTYILKQEPWFAVIVADDLLRQGRNEQAMAYLEQTQKTNSDTRILYAFGNLYCLLNKYTQAENQYKMIGFALPQLIKPKYLLAKLYYNTGQTAKWKKQAREVISFKPKIPSSFTSEMQAEIQALINKQKTDSLRRSL